MTERPRSVEFANIHVRFGKMGLLDLFDEIVWPALSDRSLVRKYRQRSYLFMEVEGHNFGSSQEPELAIGGRFVQDTMLRREQVVDRETGMLLPMTGSLESAPSAFFLLFLNHHRLIYAPETAYAPSAKSFASTLKSFLRIQRNRFIEREYERNREERARAGSRDRLTKEKLRELYPKPEVSIIHLSSPGTLDAFINRFSRIGSIEILFRDTNHEMDVEKLYEEIRQEKEEYNSTQSSVSHRSRSKNGISKGTARERLPRVTERGVNTVQLSGEDSHGDKLTGNNEDFRLKRSVEQLGDTTKRKMETTKETFDYLVAEGFISLPNISSGLKEKVKELAERYFRQ